MNGSVLLIRHAPVALHWHGRCYGRSDAGLSREGLRQSRQIARNLVRARVGRGLAGVVHSGLRRTSFLAELIAEAAGLEPRVDPRWRERDFGAWETRTWNSIWRESGNAMDGMLTDPATFRPGGGETTEELFARSVAAWRALPAESSIIVVAHAGPIACVRCWLEGASLMQLPRFRIGEATTFELPSTCTSR